jgi:uncharacterized protein YgiM (DUF1202 family)
MLEAGIEVTVLAHKDNNAWVFVQADDGRQGWALLTLS